MDKLLALQTLGKIGNEQRDALDRITERDAKVSGFIVGIVAGVLIGQGVSYAVTALYDLHMFKMLEGVL